MDAPAPPPPPADAAEAAAAYRLFPDLPPYEDMILQAMASLNSAEGSTKKMISDFIQQTHPEELPPDHHDALTRSLQSLKDRSRIVLVRNAYRFPADPAAPRPKRGRPAKSKPVADLGAKPAVVLGLSDEEPAQPKRARGRGRPPKAKASGPAQAAAAAAAPPPANGAGRPKRGRGRPPKVNVVPFASETAAAAKPKKVKPKVKAGRVEKLPAKRRGRPPKSNATTAAPSGSSASAPQPHSVEYQLLQNKVEVIQTRIKDAVGILKPHLAGEGATQVMAAIVELEAIAALDIRAPLKADADATQS